jgi:eukaryotic-like serine/threonine-protein kinase
LAAQAPSGLCLRCLAFAAGGADAPPPEPPAGFEPLLQPAAVRYFGDYELMGELARGGMGIVYYAQQATLHRGVALKIIRSGHLATARELARFHLETQAAAHLDHPNIVPLYEAGEHEGHAFFSMKLIEGGNLAEWNLDRHSRDRDWLRQSARIVAKVAHAVHHAHQRGVLHRDIKPGNILLDPAGDPHLTDFGLARLFISGPEATTTQTIVGTPSYMAPELAGGTQATTAADIYSLGAVLFELLTGRPPVEGPNALDILDQLKTTEPPKPSTLNREIDPDLETVCLKCLARDSSHRYLTAEHFAEDLELWLAGEPVLARPVSRPQRLVKWVRRNRALAGVTGAAVLALLVGLAAVMWQWSRAEQNARIAMENAERAGQSAAAAAREAHRSRTVAHVLKEMLQGIRPSIALGRDTTLFLEIVEATAARLAVSLAEEPEVEAELRSVLGMAYEELGEYEKAEAMHREALKLRQAHLGEHRDTANALVNLSSVLRSYSYFAASETFSLHPLPGLREKLEEAGELVRMAIAMRQKLGMSEAEVAGAQGALGTVLYFQRNLEEAERVSRQALKRLERLLPPDHPHVLTARNNLALILGDLDKLEEAEAIYRDLLSFRRQQLASHHPELATLLLNMGLVLKRQNRFAEAEAAYTEAVEIERQLQRARHSSLPALLSELGEVLLSLGRLGPAEQAIREGLQLTMERFGESSGPAAVTLVNLADLLIEKGEHDEAAALLEKALEIEQTLYGHNHPAIAGTLKSFSNLRHQQGNFSEAETLLQSALTLERRIATPNPVRIAEWLNDLAGLLRHLQRNSEVESTLREALDITHASSSGRAVPAPILGRTLHHLAHALLERSELAQAREFAEEAVSLYRKQPNWPRHDRMHALEVLIEVLTRNGDIEALASPYREFIAVQREWRGPGHVDEANSLHQLGLALLRQRKAEEAGQAFAEALDVLRVLMEQDSSQDLPLLGAVLHHQAEVLRQLRQPAQARPLAEEALALYDLYQHWPDDERDHAFQVLVAVLGDLGESTDSERMLRSRIARQKAQPDLQPSVVANSLHQLGQFLVRQKKLAEAAETLRHSLKWIENSPDRDTTVHRQFRAAVLHHLADVLRQLDALPSARLMAEEAFAIYEADLSAPESERRHARQVLESVLRAKRDGAGLAAFYRLVSGETVPGSDAERLDRAVLLALMTAFLIELEEFVAAEDFARESLAIRKRLIPDDWRTFNSESLLGACLLGQKKFDQAEPLLISGYEGMREREHAIPQSARIRLEEALQRLIQHAREIGRTDRAARWEKELK